MSIRICPSILNANRADIHAEVAKIEQTSDWLHLDVMDGVFVPNVSFTDVECEAIIKNTSLPVDAHLMIANPDDRAVDYAQMGAQSVTFHFEASHSPRQTIESLRQRGVRVGLGIKPATSFLEIVDLIDTLDMLLVMTVEPGFGGQSFMRDMLPKITLAKKYIEENDLSTWLQVDGGISIETISEAFEAGADTFVAGSAVFKASNPSEMVSRIRNAISLR